LTLLAPLAVSPETESPHKLPAERRYFNISVLWIFYYERVIHALYRLRVRHEVATPASIGSGLAAGAYRGLEAGMSLWFDHRNLMVANSALCFGTHAFVLIVCLIAGSPFWFLPLVVVGMNLYWSTIILTRAVTFRRGLTVSVA